MMYLAILLLRENLEPLRLSFWAISLGTGGHKADLNSTVDG